MRNIIDVINESNLPVNVILNGSGSMNDKDMKESIKKVLKQFSNANLFVYNAADDVVEELNSIKEFKPSGPHNNKLVGLNKFFMDHIGENNIFMAN